MARSRKIRQKQIDAVLELLDRIENELPSGSSITITDGEGEEEIELEEDRSIQVDDIDLVIDLAIMEFQKNGILPKKKKGQYSLGGVFETLFGEESPVVELAIDLETALSGYEDMLWSDDAESALELIEGIRDWIKEETRDGSVTGQN